MAARQPEVPVSLMSLREASAVSWLQSFLLEFSAFGEGPWEIDATAFGDYAATFAPRSEACASRQSSLPKSLQSSDFVAMSNSGKAGLQPGRIPGIWRDQR